MPTGQHFHRIDTLELKSQIERKIGRKKTETYFDLLRRFLSLKIGKSEFDKLCIATIGRENVHIHNTFLGAIIKNASLARTPPPRRDGLATSLITKKLVNGCQRNCIQSLCKDLPQSPRKGRTPNLRERKFKDRRSPLGPNGKRNVTVIPKRRKQNGTTELFYLSSRPACSDEDGEEFEQLTESPQILSRSPIRAPLGICFNKGATRQVLCKKSVPGSHIKTCYSSGELPDMSSLKKRLEQKLETEGLEVSAQCVDLLNNGLNVFMKRLIKPCLELSRARTRRKSMDRRISSLLPGLNGIKHLMDPRQCVCASLSDFQVTVGLNPGILGEDWPTQLEKIQLRASEE